ncbi:unnamed protein product [Protopolystoma xenopodis]|uniref:Uncharacterized protein n=1 Tax=Protopolystoma xenopodis TaxID=117903 RepID=A0A448X3E1_9PLAT|nr:unnamed protein product [Protopolystoma xenopodis]
MDGRGTRGLLLKEICVRGEGLQKGLEEGRDSSNGVRRGVVKEAGTKATEMSGTSVNSKTLEEFPMATAESIASDIRIDHKFCEEEDDEEVVDVETVISEEKAPTKTPFSSPPIMRTTSAQRQHLSPPPISHQSSISLAASVLDGTNKQPSWKVGGPTVIQMARPQYCMYCGAHFPSSPTGLDNSELWAHSVRCAQQPNTRALTTVSSGTEGLDTVLCRPNRTALPLSPPKSIAFQPSVIQTPTCTPSCPHLPVFVSTPPVFTASATLKSAGEPETQSPQVRWESSEPAGERRVHQAEIEATQAHYLQFMGAWLTQLLWQIGEPNNSLADIKGAFAQSLLRQCCCE